MVKKRNKRKIRYNKDKRKEIIKAQKKRSRENIIRNTIQYYSIQVWSINQIRDGCCTTILKIRKVLFYL